MRGSLSAAIAIVALTCAACSGGGHNSMANPIAPGSPVSGPAPAAPTVSSVAVTVGSVNASTLHLIAIARLADGSSLDVTSAAVWTSSNPQGATVLAGGVTVVASGETDVRATYENVTGTQHFLLKKMYAVSGVVRDASTSQPLANATVRILGGSLPAVATNADGTFTFPAVSPGRVLIEVTKVGYAMWERDAVIDPDVTVTIELSLAVTRND